MVKTKKHRVTTKPKTSAVAPHPLPRRDVLVQLAKQLREDYPDDWADRFVTIGRVIGTWRNEVWNGELTLAMNELLSADKVLLHEERLGAIWPVMIVDGAPGADMSTQLKEFPIKAEAAAALLNVSEETLRRWIRLGGPECPPAYRTVGGQLRFYESELLKWMRRKVKRVR